jgi:sortase A
MSKVAHTAQGRISRFFDILGRSMIAAGLLLLSFVAYQLWGTGLSEGRAQNTLAAQFVTQQPTKPQFGGLVGRISIPSIGLSKFVVAGVRLSDLKKGPGLFAGSPLPGQLGNVAIAGHRTTYGAPFSRIDEIHDGDVISLESDNGKFTYIVKGEPRIIAATDIAVARTTDPTTATLTLVSCHPKWTSSKRIIVVAMLDSSTAPTPATPLPLSTTQQQQSRDGWFHDSAAWPLVLLLGIVLIAIAVIAIISSRRGLNKIFVYALATVFFVPILFFFFTGLSRLLPTNI